MSTQNPNERFVVAKDVTEFKPSLAPRPLELSPPPPAKDADFAAYAKADWQKIALLAKSYQNQAAFLDDVDWTTAFAYAAKAVETMLSAVADKKEPILAIAELPPLAMASVGEMLRELGFGNVAYRFSRPFFVNSANKGFEAGLFACGYASYAPLKKKFDAAVGSVRKKRLFEGDSDSRYFLIAENPAIPSDAATHAIDPYMKTQVGYKDAPPVYRVDTYPPIPFLISKNVKRIEFFDSDGHPGRDAEEYREDVEASKAAKFKFHDSLGRFPERGISAYDAYLVSESRGYAEYRRKLEATAEKTAAALRGTSGYSKGSKTGNPSNSGRYSDYDLSKPATSSGSRGIAVAYLIGIPILFIFFLLSEYGKWNGLSGASSGNGSSPSFRGTSSWGGGSSSSYSSSSSSKSTSIRSFGGGGFSKGGG